FGNEDYAATVGPQSNVFTRRARIEARGNISENVVVYIQPSFEGGRNLSNVATTCTSSPVPVGGGTPTITCRTTGRSGLRLRDAWIDVRFTKEENPGAFYLFAGAGFLSHDVGASLRYEYKLNDLQLVTVKFGAYNGQGESLNDVNNKKSFGARATVAVTSKIDIGGSFFSHDGITTVGAVTDSG